MNFSEWYYFLEEIALIILFIRLVYYLTRRNKFLFSNLEIGLYILILLANNLMFNYWGDVSVTPLMFDILAPVSVIIAIRLIKNSNLIVTLLVIPVASLILYSVWNNYLCYILYIAAITLLIKKAIVLSKRGSIEVKKSSLYIFIALDMLFSLMVTFSSTVTFDWSLSRYVGLMWYLDLTIFTLTIIMLHVKLRRFFIA